MKKNFTKIIASLAVILVLLPVQINKAQVQRNPVIEACTGTWCQWCPCGHEIIDDILVTMPNAVVIEYHGPVGNPTDPWDDFPGNSIIGLLGFSAYPTGIIDRTSAPQSRSAWPGLMNSRLSIPSPIDITIDKNYNKLTRELDVTVHSTALQNLTGEYRMSFIILESGLVYPQTGNSSCAGASNYVHNHVVRSMINGAQGEALNGTTAWNSGETISKNIQYTVPAGFIADSCELAAFVYKVSSPFYNGEIQQADKWPLVSPDYVVTVSSTSSDVITENNTPAQYTTVIKNEGLLDDRYYIEGSVNVSGWTGEFTTSNGTTSFGQMDSIEVAAGDSAVISVEVNPNGINGFGITEIQFSSINDPGQIVISSLRTVTTTGIDMLVVDASEEDYSSLITSSLENVFTGTYGVVTKEAVDNPSIDLSNYLVIMWTSGDALPVLTTDQVTLLSNYLDQDGRLFIGSQNLGEDIFGASGQSQHAQSFYSNYMNAAYVANFGGSYFITAVANEPISEGLNFPLNDLYDRSPDQIDPLNADATPVFKFGNTTKYAGLKINTNDYRVVYFSFGLEQISDDAIKDTIVSRVINWLMEGIQVPVELSSFSASVSSKNIKLEWTTASELNNRGFEIEKSTDGVSFFNIGFRQGAGTTTETNQYFFDDKVSLNKKTNLYYRLKQFDYDGSYEYSNVLEVTFDMPLEFALEQNYPNPFNPSTTISYSVQKESQVSLKIYDLMGAEVAELVNEKQPEGFYEIQFDASNLSSGMYFYKLSAGNFTSIKKMTLLK